MELDSVFQYLGLFALGVLVYMAFFSLYPIIAKSAKTERMTNPDSARFLFFHVPWCPWCKKARPQWDAFRKDMETHPATFGGKTVRLEEYNGDDHPAMLKQNGVSAYPAFVLVSTAGIEVMNTIPTREGMRDFLVRTLGPEKYAELPPSAQ